MDKGRWRLSTDATETLDEAAQTRLGDLKRWLTRQTRTSRLPDLLIEVDNDLRFTDHFLPPAQRGGRDSEDVCMILAATLAHGCNIGLHTMAQITQGVAYKQLKRISDWQMTEEAQRAYRGHDDGLARTVDPSSSVPCPCTPPTMCPSGHRRRRATPARRCRRRSRLCVQLRVLPERES